MKRIYGIISVVILLLCLFPLTASAAHKYGTDLTGSNVGAQNYSYNWASPVHSYLSTSKTGKLMTVSYTNSSLEVAYYNSDYSLYKTITVAKELPIFGGFYETENNYYLLTGQNNLDENPKRQVYRVTKYDKSWNRLGAVGLYDCNTTVPFDGGSARFTHKGNVLVVRTCHEMYQSSDGLNHQANLTFSVNTDKMTIIKSHHGIANVNWGGYVSHSFNQFIRYDNNQLVAVDHGDAHPRTISLVKYKPEAFKSDDVSVEKVYSMLNIPGATGDNYTGVSIGGFEVSPSTYIVVGNSELNTSPTGPRNVFVSKLSRTGSTSKLTYLTSYTSPSTSASVPHIVKISTNYYMVLWSVNDYVYYAILDNQGNKYGSTLKMKGELSDCAPVVINQKVQWYTYRGNDVTFYAISTTSLGSTTRKTVNHGHTYQQKCNSTYHWDVCTQCGKIKNKATHTDTTAHTYKGFDAKGNWVRACKVCDYAFRSYKVTVILKSTKDSAGNEVLTPVLKTAAGVLKEGVHYQYFQSSYSYTFDKNGSIKYIQSSFDFFGVSPYSKHFSKTFNSLPNNSATISAILNQPYTGKEVKPAVKVTFKGKTLKNGTDYVVTYKNNVKKGTATAVVTGINGYFGSITKTFRIAPSITSATVTGLRSTTYNGKKQTQNPKVVLNGKTLKNGVDYALSYANNLSAGTATLKIIGKGSYAGTITKTFLIRPIDVSTCKITLTTSAYTYNGTVRTPGVAVVNANGTTLKKGTHYTVTYQSGRKNVGTYKIVVKMIGNYGGTKTLYFKINPVKTTIEKLTPGSKKITINITKQSSQVTGYQLQFSTSKAFTNAVTKTISSYGTTKYTLSGLSTGKTYYVRVRTYKTVGEKNYYSGWSAYKYAKAK